MISNSTIPIIDVNHGVANNFGTYIEINKNLRKYPELLNPILEHERAHTDKKASMEDFKLDFLMPTAIYYKELFKFMVRYPKSLTQLFPLYWTKKQGFVFDFNLMVMYLIMGTIITSTIYLGGKFL